MAQGAYNLEEFIRTLESWGLTDVLLPFLIIFVVIFAILQKARIFGEEKKNFNMVIALAIGLLVVIPHVLDTYPEGADVVKIMNSALPNVSIIAVAIIMMLIIIGLFGGEAKWMGGSLSGVVGIVAFILVIAIFGGAAGWWGNWSWFTDFFSEDAVAVIVIVLVFAIIVSWVTKGEGMEKEKAGFGKIAKGVQDLFGGGKE